MNEEEIDFTWYYIKGWLKKRAERKRIRIFNIVYGALILSNLATFYFIKKWDTGAFFGALVILFTIFGIVFKRNLIDYVFKEREWVLFEFPDEPWGWEFLRYIGSTHYKGEFEEAIIYFIDKCLPSQKTVTGYSSFCTLMKYYFLKKMKKGCPITPAEFQEQLSWVVIPAPESSINLKN